LLEAASALAAWLGVSLVVLADGRRGLATGTVIATLGLAGAVWPEAGLPAALAIVVGGAIAAARRYMAGPEGWQIMPAGSTPRLVLCVAGGLLALWVGLAVTSGHSAGLRFAVMSAVGLAGARALIGDDASVAQTALAVLAVAVAAAAGLSPQPAGVWPYLAAAAIAAAVTLMPQRAPRAA
jgi:hypothetical protein